MGKNMIEERKKEVKLVFNMKGSGFGEEIDESKKNKKCVTDHINGNISRDELANKLLEEINNECK